MAHTHTPKWPISLNSNFETVGSWHGSNNVCINQLTKSHIQLDYAELLKSARIAIIVGVGVPGFLCLLGFICCIGRRVWRGCCWRHQQPVMEFSVMVVPYPGSTRSGLDGATIESYPKTVLGESRRLPNPDDNICSICLSEYVAKDTLRTMPDCQHSFHVECIDEWLQQNPSCPVCRNSPNPSTPTQAD